MSIMTIEGHKAVIAYDSETDLLRGEFVGLRGGADFYARDIEGLRKEGATSLRVFLDMCREKGITPEKPYSGKFNVRIAPGLHASIAGAAAAERKSLNAWVEAALAQAVGSRKEMKATKENPVDFIAHAKKNKTGDWLPPHKLEDHLRKVAALAGSKILDKKAARWAALAGKWHDLGKYQAAFQDYIRNKSGFERENAHIEGGAPGRVTHSTTGAVHAIKTLGYRRGAIIAYLIAGHHAGLPDCPGNKGGLDVRLLEGEQEYANSLKENIPEDILTAHELSDPVFSCSHSLALWIRMLFSALVDADFLDTEQYMNGTKTAKRGGYPALSTLLDRYRSFMSDLQSRAEKNPGKVNSIRQQVLESCRQAAAKPPGIFSLTVPTGGGKTLSSLGFSLEHAHIHNKRRIVYAIPYTSIIEQNADVFRQCLGEDAVIEHHSNLDCEPSDEHSRRRLAAENWDAPVIVTTNVQLFESLHASRTSRCRKLHNLQDAVIVLDEAQQLPRDFHSPIVRCMKSLSQDFGVTWVLCTATQPDLSSQKSSFEKNLLDGLGHVEEIMEDPDGLADQLKRVEVSMPQVNDTESWESIAEKIRPEPCVLAIVNTRQQARKLFDLLPEEGDKFHLSANMCPEHRTIVLKNIRKRLDERRSGDPRPVRVVSTQLIEAGVDIDFPVVYRAMAGLDSIAQSAGRCNREGRLECGQVFVFSPPDQMKPCYLKETRQLTEGMLKKGELDNPLSPRSFREFFRLLNSQGDRDEHEINKLLQPKRSKGNGPVEIQFRTAAQKFRMIDENGIAVIVPFCHNGLNDSSVDNLLKMLEKNPQLWLQRKIQRYTVTLPEKWVGQYREAGLIENRAGLWCLDAACYDDTLGAIPPDSLLTAEASVVY